MNTVHDHWEKYRDSVLGENTNAGELAVFKTAFYAGAAALDKIFISISSLNCSIEAKKIAAISAREEINDYFSAELSKIILAELGEQNGQD